MSSFRFPTPIMSSFRARTAATKNTKHDAARRNVARYYQTGVSLVSDSAKSAARNRSCDIQQTTSDVPTLRPLSGTCVQLQARTNLFGQRCIISPVAHMLVCLNKNKARYPLPAWRRVQLRQASSRSRQKAFTKMLGGFFRAVKKRATALPTAASASSAMRRFTKVSVWTCAPKMLFTKSTSSC